jgi:hypothetical protein
MVYLYLAYNSPIDNRKTAVIYRLFVIEMEVIS